MSTTQLSAEFIRQICVTYRLNEADMQAVMIEHKELKVFLAMLRAASEMQEEPAPEFLVYLTRLMAHLDKTALIIKRLQNVAKQVNAVMGEYEP